MMKNQELISELETLIAAYLEERHFDLVEYICRYEGRNLVLRILVDKPEGGISIEECAAINTQLSSILDEKDIITESYVLEVSSPGLDRPLKTQKDFIRCINREVRFFLAEHMNGKIEFKGVIREVKDGVVSVEAEGRLIEIAMGKIFRAKQVIA